MSPSGFFALTWSLYRLQLVAIEATTAMWWTAGYQLWLPRGAMRRRSAPTLAEMLRETRQDTYQTDDDGGVTP